MSQETQFKLAQRKEQLKKKQAAIKAQLQRLENIERHNTKKIETRRKILVGAYFLEKFE